MGFQIREIKVNLELDSNKFTEKEELIKGEFNETETWEEFRERVDHALRKLETLYDE